MKLPSLLLTALAATIALPGHAQTAKVNWAHTNGMQRNDGAINVRTAAYPATPVATRQNPTAAEVKPSANVATQPPLLVVEKKASTDINRWSLYYADRVVGLP